jgi:RNA polymerase sigma factor (sigma-70 family)
LGVCHRLLGDTPDADDAFQATFIVLARRAGAVRRGESLGCWLYGVAVRVAHKALRRRPPPVPPPRPGPPDPAHVAAWREVARVLDDELGRLPDRLRAPLVLCYLHGGTRDEAAAELGWSLSTLKRRLDRAREVLRARLAGRGLAPAGLAGLVWGTTATAVPPPLRATAVEAAHAPTAAAGRLADAVAGGSGLLRLKLAAGVALVAVTGLGLAHGIPAPTGPDNPPAPAPREAAPAVAPVDPLRPGAVARLGAGGLRVPGGATQVAFPADSRTMFVGCREGGVRQWDLTTGHELRRFGGTRTFADGVAVTPDGKLLAIGGSRSVEVWDTETATVLTRLTSGGTARGLSISPDGRIVAGWGREAIQIWDVAAGRLHATLPAGHTNHAVFTPDGKTLVTAALGADAVRIWDVVRGKQTGTVDSSNGALAIAVAPDGKVLATVTGETSVGLWALPGGEPIRRLEGPRRSGAVGFTADGKKLIGVGERVRVWEVATGDTTFDGPVEEALLGWALGGASVSTDGQSVVVGRNRPVLRVLDVSTGRERFPGQPGHRDGVRHLAFSPDGRTLASASYADSRVRFWDPRAARPAEPLREPVPGGNTFAWSADGKRLVSGTQRKVVVHDAATGATRSEWTPPGDVSVDLVAYLGTSYQVVIGCEDGIIRIWDPASGKDPRELTGLEERLGEHKALAALATSPDGKWVAAAAFQDSRFAVWDVESGKLARPLGPEDADRRGSVYGLAFAPGGRAVAVIEGEVIRLYDPVDGKELKAFHTGFAGWAGGVAFSADGKSLAAVSTEGPVYVQENGRKAGSADHPREGYVRVWDLATGRELRRFRDPENSPYCLAFAPDGRLLATAGTDGVITLWDVAAPTPLADLPPEIPLPKRGGAKPAPEAIPDADLARHWDALAGADTRSGLQAAAALAAGGDRVVSFLVGRVKPVAAPDPARVARLLTDLDDDTFAVRERAKADLAALGELAAPALRKRLGEQPSVEFRRRAEGLLGRVVPDLPIGDRLREVRAVRVLERIGTPEARAALTRLSEGADGARLTREAKEALRPPAKSKP